MKKLTVYLLLIVTLLTLLPAGVFTADETVTTVIAASDFQSKDGGKEGIKEFKKLLSSVKKDGIQSADGFLFCGDYDFGTFGASDKTREGIGLLSDAVSDMVASENMVFVQGNHDAVPGTAGLNPGGNNDPKSGKYGVFTINNADYMWYNKDENRIKRTAQQLITYLNEKLAKGYDKPIFVISHVPLHYNMRTVRDGDGKHANYIFNALNEAGAKGLNIIYLFGHNHSNGWDDYLGGSSIYLTKGDELLVAQNSQSKFESKTLNFTYMNAGYTGYYDLHNKGADNTLTMTSFRIMPSGAVVITRYDVLGTHNLKSEGVRNAYKDEKAYAPNTKVYGPRQTVTLTKVTDQKPIKDIMKLRNEGRQYKRINHLSELQDGKQYLVIYNDDTQQMMPPKEVEYADKSGSRIGMDLENVYVFGDFLAYGNYGIKEWTFHLAGNRWLLESGGKFLFLSQTADKGIAASLSGNGSAFNLEGEGVYTFTCGDYVLNYNSRGLINGYTEDPAEFYIYEYVGYTISVTDGSAYLDGETVTVADVGQTLTVKAWDVPEGMYFGGWEVKKGGIELADAMQKEITITMPDAHVELIATYTETDPNAHTPGEEPTDSSDNASKDGNNTIVFIAIGAGAVVLVGIAVAALLVVKRKKK